MRLGKALTDECETNGVHYRVFEGGFVALNPEKDAPRTLPLAAPMPTKKLVDVFAATKTVLDASEKGSVEIPANSGRVYLFAAGNANDLAPGSGPTLTIQTKPAMGEVRFKVDGFDYWTHSGRWTTQYELGSEFGKFSIHFDKPGRHRVEIVDVVPGDMKTQQGYGAGERLGQFMDPSNPTQPSGGKKFRFREWDGGDKAAAIEVDANETKTLTAHFDVEETTTVK